MMRLLAVLACASLASLPLAASQDGPLTQPVIGYAYDPQGAAKGGLFTGKLSVVGVKKQNGVVTFLSHIEPKSRITWEDGTFHEFDTPIQLGGSAPSRKLLATTPTTGTLPVLLSASGTCDILRLDLGAIHLDLLGLVVDLAPVHLDITAQSGPGNLLGNLLCAVAGLLNGNGLNLNPLVQQLSTILTTLLNGLG